MINRVVISFFGPLLAFLLFVEGSFHSHEIDSNSLGTCIEHCFLCKYFSNVEPQSIEPDWDIVLNDSENYFLLPFSRSRPLCGSVSGDRIRSPPTV